MTREQATKEAREIAKRDNVRMVVTFDPYAENPDTTQNYGYFPNAATGIFKYEEVVETIEAGGGVSDRLILDMPDKGCVVWFGEWQGRQCLAGCERSDFYRAGGVEEADAQLLSFDLTAPEDQAFLDRINAAFGTSLRFEDFAGR